MKKIGINGSFIRKPASGMGQVSWHFLQQLINDASHGKYSTKKFVIYLEEDLPSGFINNNIKLPKNIKFKVIKGWYQRDDLIKKILWEKFWLPAQIKKDKCAILLNLYQSATIVPKGIKHKMLVHDVVPKVFPKYLNNIRKKIYYFLVDRAIVRANQILTISQYSKKEIIKYYNLPKDKIVVDYIACDFILQKQLDDKEKTGILKKYDIKTNEKFIFYVGGFDRRKNIDRLIEAYVELIAGNLREKKGKITLVLGGTFHKHLAPLVTDVEEKIKEVIERYDLKKDMFKLVGFVEQEDLPAFFQSAEVFIYPSLYEGFGMPVLEAMTSGTPVVTSNTTSIPEVISEKAGYLIDDPTSVEEIKNKLQEALGDSEENRQAKITLAQQEAQKFSWEKFTNKVMEEIAGKEI